MKVGVLALQGAFAEHIHLLQRSAQNLNVEIEIVQVKKPEELQGLDGLIIPGGESTTMAIVAERNGLWTPLKEWVSQTKAPVWGTCAGLILLADKISNPKQGGQNSLGGLDIVVERNAFGSQRDSFVALVPSPTNDTPEFNAVFIRAPRIAQVNTSSSPPVQVLATVNHHLAPGHDPNDEKGVVVAVRQGNKLGTAFHPELTNDDRWHRYFLEMIQGK